MKVHIPSDNARKAVLRIILILLLSGTLLSHAESARPTSLQATTNALPQRAPTIHDLETNLSDYPGNMIPRYEKLEITFEVDTPATNFYFPYDESPPAGLSPSTGITIDALFTPDNWQTVYRQPAFYYQHFEYERLGNRDWIYPTSDYSWVVRFSPNQPGDWQFKIVSEDSGGAGESAVQSFMVAESDNPGFMRVSETDDRYFEFEDGTYFSGLGYNMNYRDLDWIYPIASNEPHFQIMAENGIELVRIWLSQWSIFGAEWNPWRSFVGNGYFPFEALTLEQVHPDSEISLKISAGFNKCVLVGWEAPRIPLKPDTPYRVGVRYKIVNLGAPRDASQPAGLVAKFGGWLWSDTDPSLRCDYPGTGQRVTPHAHQDTVGWELLEGSFNSGSNDFADNFYLALENTDEGAAYIDEVWIREELGDGLLGPNLIQKPDMDHHTYFDQRNSFAFDQVLELAAQYDLYLRPVILEKNDWIFNRLTAEGLIDGSNPTNENFYGEWRTVTRVRWLHQAWWRYLQARWGYSQNIHSWELLNEGDPFNSRHYALADEFGAYMHQFQPNDHLVSTSFWHSFPGDQFWANEAYDHLDFADIHKYIPESHADFEDAAQATNTVSDRYGAYQSDGAGKPVIRGETGFVVSGSEPPTSQFESDAEGLWLHNFIWGGINPGGLIESYWYSTRHIYSQRGDGSYRFDHRSQFKSYADFLEGIPLNNGSYRAVDLQASSPDLRAWGQMDPDNQQAHLWIQNVNHTWKNIVDELPISDLSGSIAISGFQPGESYELVWWDTYAVDPDDQLLNTETLDADPDGVLNIPIQNLTSDLALKIAPLNPTGLPYDLFLPVIVK